MPKTYFTALYIYFSQSIHHESKTNTEKMSFEWLHKGMYHVIGRVGAPNGIINHPVVSFQIFASGLKQWLTTYYH